MKNFFALALVLCSSLLLQAAKVNKEVTVNVGNESRKYWLYVPTNVTSNCPLVISLHGASGHDTDKSPFRTDVADAAGCIVAYPQGNEIYFPVFGGTVTGWDASGESNNDTEFLKAVIEDVASKYTIDRKRIYCCGFSNGGMMTYANTNTCSDIFAAFASISGFPLNEFHFRHTGYRPVPFLHIHGKNDDFVKYSLMPTIVDEIVARNGANPVPTKTVKSGIFTKSIYEAGEGSFPYVYYEIDGMGHNDYTANTEKNNSAQTMWDFFKQYTLDSPCDTTLKWRPRLETEGFAPKSHGWKVNTGLTLLLFGNEQKTDANQNVYHSLQFTPGNYKLCFKTTGDEGKNITVKIQKVGKSTYPLNTSVAVGGSVVLPFEIKGSWGEYKLTITRAASTDQITITDLAVYSMTPEEVAAISAPHKTSVADQTAYSLAGQKLNGTPRKTGVYVKKGRKYVRK